MSNAFDFEARYKGLGGENPVIEYDGKKAAVAYGVTKAAQLIDTTGAVVWDATTNALDDRIELVRRAAERDELDALIVPHIITTNGVDRVNDSMSIAGGELDNYRANPIIAYSHWPDFHVGNSKKLIRTDDSIISHTWFHCLNDLSKDIAKMSLSGVMPATSIGFLPKQWEDTPITAAQQASGEFYPTWNNSKRLYTKWELLEYSIVPIPMNPQAIEQRGIDEIVHQGVTRGLIAADSAVCKALTGTIRVKTAGGDVAPQEKSQPITRKKSMDEKLNAAIESIAQGTALGLTAMDAAGENYDASGVDLIKALAKGLGRIAGDIVNTSQNDQALAIANAAVKASKTLVAAANEMLGGNTATPEPTDTTATDTTTDPAADPSVQMDASLSGLEVKAGAVLSQKNKADLTQAKELIDGVLASAAPADSGKGYVTAKEYESDMRAVLGKLEEIKRGMTEPKPVPPKKKRLSEVL